MLYYRPFLILALASLAVMRNDLSVLNLSALSLIIAAFFGSTY